MAALPTRPAGEPIWRDGKDSSVRVWDVETGREVRKLEGHKGRVLSVAVSPDGRSVLTGGDTRVILWDASDGKIIRRFDGHSSLLSRVSFLPDGKRVISSSYDKTIRLWDLQTGKEIHRFVGHPREVTWFAVSPDGRRLLSSDYNAHELRLWDLNTHEQIDRIDLGTISPTRGSFSADSRHAVWPGTGGFLGVYEFLTSEPAQPLARSTQPFDAPTPGAESSGAPR
jgi:WD40 repeat protein